VPHETHRQVASEPPPIPAAAIQRWRLTVARGADLPDATQRDTLAVWGSALIDAGLPVARSAGNTKRTRISIGAPLPAGIATEGDLVDVLLTERWPIWRVRSTLSEALPDGWRLVALEDVWVGEPALAGQVAAADYRIVIGTGSAPDEMSAACAQVLAARTLPRQRLKGDRVVAYDLRPLVVDVRLAGGDRPLTLVARTRYHPERGTGRPEELVAALADVLGEPVAIIDVTRTRLLRAEEID